MAFWENELAKSEWFAGHELTAADIQMSFPLEAASARAGLDQGHPKAMAFLARIHARPAYARALEKGGPYSVGRRLGASSATPEPRRPTAAPSP
jgi:glutathione S-transferase